MPREVQRLRRRREALPFAAVLPLVAALLLLLLPGRVPSAPLLAVSPDPPSPCVFTGVEKIVAIGDLHGAYDPFVEILTDLKIIDRRLHWIAGKTHLVQMGDVMDRGPAAREILDLIRRLEIEAGEAGGAVHMLLGNHEEMNILGLSFEIKGYVTPEQFRAFLPDWIRNRKDAEFEAEASTYGEYNLLWERYMEGNPQARNVYTKYFNEHYGRWLAGHPVVIKINDVVFVHGGLTEALSTQPCELINSATAHEFDRYFWKEEFAWSWLYQTRGPLWYRDLATKDEETIREETDRILANLGARAIVVGHTPTAAVVFGRSNSRLGGKIWIIDTGIWMKEGGYKSALIITDGKFQMKSLPRRKAR
ncbi:MAG: metallophosphoesterase [Candidatus Aminicenantes bacterium]|nr:metallophosphoesterase [Candidatus Aminicenantes bacterium]